MNAALQRILMGQQVGFDPRTVSPGNLVAWYDATRVINRVDGDPLLVWRNLMSTSALPQWDTFTRADSTTSLGSAESGMAWGTPGQGTFGITSNQGYSVTDADGDIVDMNAGIVDGVFSAVMKGTLNSATDYRTTDLVFRKVDASNYLYVRLLNGNADLRKCDGGVHSSLGTGAQTTADNTAYTTRVVANGNSVTVYVDNTSRISHTLAGGNTKYAGSTYTYAGFRLSKAGSPATAAVWDNFIVARLSDAIQGTTASQPSYQTLEQNSRPIVRFDGGDGLQAASVSLGAFTKFVVYKASANGILVEQSADGNSNPGSYIYTSTGNSISARRGSTQSGKNLRVSWGSDSAWRIAVQTYNGTHATHGLHLNGSEEGLSAGSNTGDPGTGTVTDALNIGCRNQASLRFTGDIATILVYNTALSTTQRRKTEKGLSRTWGVSLTNILVSDVFDRSDSTTTLGNTDTGQAYEVLSGTWGISSNKAYVATSSGGADRVHITAVADCTLQATFSIIANQQRLLFRASDASNEWYVQANTAGQWELTKRVSGTPTTVGTYVAAPANGDVIRVVTSGNSITVYVNGTSRITATDSFNNTATKCGFAGVNSSTFRFDNLYIEA